MQKIQITCSLFLSLFSDSERRLLLATTHSSANTSGQRCVHGVSHCSQGAQLFPQCKAASAHPSGAHHSQLMRGHTLWTLFTSVLCAAAAAAAAVGGEKKHRHRGKKQLTQQLHYSLLFVQITAKQRYLWLIITFIPSIRLTGQLMI